MTTKKLSQISDEEAVKRVHPGAYMTPHGYVIVWDPKVAGVAQKELLYAWGWNEARQHPTVQAWERSKAAEEAKSIDPYPEVSNFNADGSPVNWKWAYMQHEETIKYMSSEIDRLIKEPESTAVGAGDVHYTDEFDAWWRANKRNDGAGLELSCKSQCYAAWVAGREVVAGDGWVGGLEGLRNIAEGCVQHNRYVFITGGEVIKLLDSYAQSTALVAELREEVADLSHRLTSKEALLRHAEESILARLPSAPAKEDK